MEQLRRDELRQLDTHNTISLLCGPADYHQPPFAPKPTSGLVEQHRWFAKVAARISGTTNQLERLKAACER
jgi:hypothetical protein